MVRDASKAEDLKDKGINIKVEDYDNLSPERSHAIHSPTPTEPDMQISCIWLNKDFFILGLIWLFLTQILI